MGKLIAVDSLDDVDQYVGYGAEHFIISKEQLQDLLAGKYLVDSDPDEYGTFISLEKK